MDTASRKLLSIAVVLLTAIAALIGIQVFAHPSEAWSYAVIAPKDDDLIQELNRAGALGWKLFSPDEPRAEAIHPLPPLTK